MLISGISVVNKIKTIINMNKFYYPMTTKEYIKVNIKTIIVRAQQNDR